MGTEGGRFHHRHAHRQELVRGPFELTGNAATALLGLRYQTESPPIPGVSDLHLRQETAANTSTQIGEVKLAAETGIGPLGKQLAYVLPAYVSGIEVASEPKITSLVSVTSAVGDGIAPSPVTGLPDLRRFPDSYGYPSISGGSGKGEGGDTPESARDFLQSFYARFDEYVETKGYTKEQRDHARRMRKRARSLSRKFPEVHEEILRQYWHGKRQE